MTQQTITQLINEVGILEYKNMRLREIAKRIGKAKEYKVTLRLLWASVGVLIIGTGIIAFANLFLTNITVKTMYWEVCIAGGIIIGMGVISLIIDLVYGKKHFPDSIFFKDYIQFSKHRSHVKRNEEFQDFARRTIYQPPQC